MLNIHTTRLLGLLAFLAASPLAVVPASRAEEGDSIVFHDNYNAALQEAKLTRKPIFLEFRCAP